MVGGVDPVMSTNLQPLEGRPAPLGLAEMAALCWAKSNSLTSVPEDTLPMDRETPPPSSKHLWPALKTAQSAWF